MNATSTTRPGEASDTAVVFRCDFHVLAVFTNHVERLLLSEEVAEEPRAEGQLATRAWIDGRPWAVWDLGLLLGVSAQSAAHMLLRVPRGDDFARLALRIGPCLAVQRLPPTWPLRSQLFGSRPKALSAAFEAAALGIRTEALMGYVLEPTSLWTSAELDLSATLTAPQARAGAAGEP
jgi:hypothetical protein